MRGRGWRCEGCGRGARAEGGERGEGLAGTMRTRQWGPVEGSWRQLRAVGRQEGAMWGNERGGSYARIDRSLGATST
jgi:hypothetical protein